MLLTSLVHVGQYKMSARTADFGGWLLCDGRDLPIAETIRGFKELVEGKHDELPEQAFYMVGGIDEVIEKAKKLAAQS